ncbi:MAG TPA: recombinase family protein, partial [Acidimicrobiales bacterium]|nr:recombinase family protein [Acidimicrobiales bacterium]
MAARPETSQAKRVLIAARLSRVSQKGRTRIERDDEKAQKWAAGEGDRIVVATSEDAGVSGATDPFKRDGLGPYLTDPTKLVTYDEIVASSLDRLSRNAADLFQLRAWAEKTGKQITILSPPLRWPPDSDDYGSRIVWVVLEQLAEIELRTIKKRYADQRRDLLERGSFIGRPPFGFTVVGEKGNKSLVPDPVLVPYLHGMVDRAIRGDTLLSIAKWLDSEGIEPVQGGTWHPKSVSQVLRNPALKGRRLDAKGKVQLKYEGIMSAAEWADLQAALNSRPHRGPVRKETAFLTGSILCDVCGGPMYRMQSKKRRKDGTFYVNPAYYKCRGSDKERSTCHNMIRQDEIEPWVNQWFTGDGPFASTEIVELVVLNGADHSAEIEDLEADIHALDLDDVVYDRKFTALMTERTRLKELPAEP